MDFVTFKDLNLSSEELRDIIEFMQRKEMLITIKINRTLNHYLL